jgi:hypothetical protein
VGGVVVADHVPRNTDRQLFKLLERCDPARAQVGTAA